MVLACTMIQQLCAQEVAHQKVLFDYADVYPDDVSGYDYVILESAHFSTADIAKIKENNDVVLAYVSLGEVNEAAAHYPDIKEFTFGENKLWNSYFIDIDNKQTSSILLDIFELNIKEKGFDGMFLDNIDNYTIYGPTPSRKEALIEFLAMIKKKFPQAHLMQNAGLLILDETCPYINSLAIESVATAYDFETVEYKLRQQEEFLTIMEQLENAHTKYELPIILIEYADTTRLFNEIMERISFTEWPIFIGGIELQNIPQFKTD